MSRDNARASATRDPATSARASRVLITGVSSQLGGRVAQALERDPAFEAIMGVDTEDPRHEFGRTEFVRVALERRPLSRIIAAAGVDTVLDTRLIVDPLPAPLSRIRAVNELGTLELLEACATSGSRVTKLILKSSALYYGSQSTHPAFITEPTPPAKNATALERSIQAAESAAFDYQASHPQTAVCVIRAADEIGGEARSPLTWLLSLPFTPGMLGFDPRLAVIHHDDVVAALAHAARHELAGAYNAAADGVLVLSEIASLLGKTLLPVLPPIGTGFAAAQLRRLGLKAPVELARQLRHGRALDNRRLKASGFSPAYTSREALLQLRAQQQLRPLLTSGQEPYRYEPDLEEFLRWSPSVRRTAQNTGDEVADPLAELSEHELVHLIDSLEPEALRDLRSYEEAHRARPAVLEALERNLARQPG